MSTFMRAGIVTVVSVVISAGAFAQRGGHASGGVHASTGVHAGAGFGRASGLGHSGSGAVHGGGGAWRNGAGGYRGGNGNGFRYGRGYWGGRYPGYYGLGFGLGYWDPFWWNSGWGAAYSGYGGYGGYEGYSGSVGYSPAIGYQQPPVIVNQAFPYGDEAPAPPPEPEVREYTQGPEQGMEAPAERRPDYSPVLYLIALKNNNILAALTYWTEKGTLHYVNLQHEMKQIAVSSIDRELSERLNRERKLTFQIP